MLSPEQKEHILHCLYNLHKNRDCDIAKVTGLPKSTVREITSRESERVLDKISKRKYEDIDWGTL